MTQAEQFAENLGLSDFGAIDAREAVEMISEKVPNKGKKGDGELQDVDFRRGWYVRLAKKIEGASFSEYNSNYYQMNQRYDD